MRAKRASRKYVPFGEEAQKAVDRFSRRLKKKDPALRQMLSEMGAEKLRPAFPTGSSTSFSVREDLVFYRGTHPLVYVFVPRHCNRGCAQMLRLHNSRSILFLMCGMSGAEVDKNKRVPRPLSGV